MYPLTTLTLSCQGRGNYKVTPLQANRVLKTIIKRRRRLASFFRVVLWTGISIALSWLIFRAAVRHMDTAETKGTDKLRATEVKQRMRYHGTNAAHLGENGVWYFKDKGGRWCRL